MPFNDLFEVLSDLQHKGYEYEILFLDASDDVLIKRYKETRRSHPLSKNGSIQEGIQKEREILKDVKRKATYIIDTSQILTRQLKEQINRIFVENQSYENLMITVQSFGFKYGIPADSDLVFDVRFLPNPFYIQELKEMTGNDEPVSSYVMSFEESRTFLKKLVDIFASYKMNVLHFHFADDEAWRLEIPGLEELTAVGSRRGHTTDESRCLYPCYDGGYDPDASTVGNGHYSREDFIGLLRYAAERHIRVIPEIESPGHARAAIVSMKARYNRYKDTDMEKAAEYLLSEPEDTSRYASVQYYTDNVINVAMPSAYRFMEKVIQELAAMYEEAGVPLTTVHLGGDEVARGVWLGSPKCRALMKEEGMTKPHDLAEYFITQMAGIMQRNGLKFSGWQEVALGHTEEAHRQLRTQAAGVYCWNTVPGYDEVVYQIANNGYPVILCNVGNFYMDMAYNGHPDERGLDWGGYVDEAISFSMLPFSIYRSLRTDGAGDSVDLDKAEKGKTVLTAEGRKNILGVQGQLFAETIRSFSGVEYLLFPKIMGLAERGWNAYPAWEKLRGAQEQQAFDKALALYYEKISDMEMPYWAKNGINFRLPHPGLLVKDGTLYANTAIRGAEIRYTMDGSEPTVNSALWEMPMKCDASVVKAGTFYQGKASLPITLKVE